MGSWLTFDVLGNKYGMQSMKEVLHHFYKEGGRVIDSSPMYGSSEEVIGILARELKILEDIWVSTKVWTDGEKSGRDQIDRSQSYFSKSIKVHHVHNMRDFQTHYNTLTEEKESGRLKYIGVTHYVNRAHDDLIELIKKHNLDFVQFNYNIANPHADEKLIPTAHDYGVATIINRPFRTGDLFRQVGKQSLPKWADEMGIKNWASYFLKYIISHSDITCAIPATRQVPHVIENVQAGKGYIPTPKEREKMRTYFQSII
jgi:diketogulonate reductase-like aldo/keto reductase